jgi:glucose-6-phosphate 1-dehydrogenase
VAEAKSDALVFFGATGDLACKKIFPSLQGGWLDAAPPGAPAK